MRVEQKGIIKNSISRIIFVGLAVLAQAAWLIAISHILVEYYTSLPGTPCLTCRVSRRTSIVRVRSPLWHNLLCYARGKLPHLVEKCIEI